MTLLETGDWKPDLQAMFASLTLLTIEEKGLVMWLGGMSGG
jgi:hypothetical protein